VTPSVAVSIVAHREQNGPFPDIWALAGVTRLGRKTFRKITGMPYSSRRYHRRLRLVTMLDLPATSRLSLPEVAQALVQKYQFSGASISDRQGLVIMDHGETPFSKGLSAVLPIMMEQLRKNVEALDVHEVGLVSMSLGSHTVTVGPSGDIYLTLYHRQNHITKAQLRAIQKVAVEIAWVLSHRGYVGAPPPAGEDGPSPAPPSLPPRP
jgi:hypothetical protein